MFRGVLPLIQDKNADSNIIIITTNSYGLLKRPHRLPCIFWALYNACFISYDPHHSPHRTVVIFTDEESGAQIRQRDLGHIACCQQSQDSSLALSTSLPQVSSHSLPHLCGPWHIHPFERLIREHHFPGQVAHVLRKHYPVPVAGWWHVSGQGEGFRTNFVLPPKWETHVPSVCFLI